MKSFAVATLAACASAATSDHWAVIMAGSNTYGNYRHQADSHHAVKIMLENGIPRENIIHLAYDDIANNTYNPFPGQLFNKPDPTGPGRNVYDKSEIDYSGAQVTKTNFFKVLLGDDSAPGPVLKSTATSKVFVFFVDHGGAGVICTPESSANWIYADELNTTLKTMKSKGMFDELVFYLETCESGSMFPNITAEDKIYAMTASNATLSSWGAYCGSEAVVNGTNIGSCLGDLFSINWMEDTEANNPSVETLEQQYETVKTKTTQSPVQKFGDFNFMSEAIGDFEGTTEAASQTYTERLLAKADHLYKKAIDTRQVSKDLVDSRDHELHFLYNQVMRSGSTESMQALEAEIEHRQFVDGLFQKFEVYANAPEIPQNFDCLRMLVGGVEEMCGDWSSYSLKYVRKLANICDTKSEEEIANIYVQIGEHCGAF